MAKTKPSWPSVTGPLAQYADGFRAELARLGYTPLTAASQLRLVAHLSRWLAAEGLDASALTAPAVETYFADAPLGGLRQRAHRRGARAAARLPARARRGSGRGGGEPGDGGRAAAGQLQDLPHPRAGACRIHGRPERPPGASFPRRARRHRAAWSSGADRRGRGVVRGGAVRPAPPVGQADSDRAALIPGLPLRRGLDRPAARPEPCPRRRAGRSPGFPGRCRTAEVAALLASCDRRAPDRAAGPGDPHLARPARPARR